MIADLGWKCKSIFSFEPRNCVSSKTNVNMSYSTQWAYDENGVHGELTQLILLLNMSNTVWVRMQERG